MLPMIYPSHILMIQQPQGVTADDYGDVEHVACRRPPFCCYTLELGAVPAFLEEETGSLEFGVKMLSFYFSLYKVFRYI